MKNLIMICALVMLLAAFGSTAKAENPLNTSFDVLTFGPPAFWDSATNVDTGYPQYDYTWQTNYEDLLIDGDWYPRDLESDSGTAYGLPFDILNELDEEPGIIAYDIHAYVGTLGFGHISLTNIVFGSVGGHPVEGLRLGGEATVEGVPEPATLSFLALGSLALLRKRRA